MSKDVEDAIKAREAGKKPARKSKAKPKAESTS
jgi:hypothetical protein